MQETSNSAIECAAECSGAALLNQTASYLSEEISLQDCLDRTVRFVASVLKCNSCTIYSLEETRLILRAGHNAPKRVTNRLKFRKVQELAGWSTKRHFMFAIEERASEDPRARLFNEFLLEPFESFFSLPLLSAGRCVGVLNALHWGVLSFANSDLRSVATMGFLAANAVERARLTKENSLLIDKLETRKLVERAKAILQERLHVGEETAYRTMQRQSQEKNKSMKEVAAAVIFSAEVQKSSSSANADET